MAKTCQYIQYNPWHMLYVSLITGLKYTLKGCFHESATYPYVNLWAKVALPLKDFWGSVGRGATPSRELLPGNVVVTEAKVYNRSTHSSKSLSKWWLQKGQYRDFVGNHIRISATFHRVDWVAPWMLPQCLVCGWEMESTASCTSTPRAGLMWRIW